ncbi:hypothetical protein [Streptomyces sp. NPDC057740]|uniref:hypothetical protein n=1 Tax=Streptomyces sp. NPDC057740 TaxID=3346234 RepID=UPI0036B89F71
MEGQKGNDESQGQMGGKLASRDDVRELLARQAAERKSGRSSKVTVEFRFALPGRQYEALAAAHADLTDVELVVAARQLPFGKVRFPAAAYHAETPPGRKGGYWLSRTTFWVLGEPLLHTASPDGLPAAPADSSAGGRLIG